MNLSLEINKDINCDNKDPTQFVDDKLYFAGSFVYFSNYKDLSEHEFGYVFVYTVNSIIPEIKFNTSEVSDIKWLTIKEIHDWMDKSPDDFSSWFKTAFMLAEKSLGNFCIA